MRTLKLSALALSAALALASCGGTPAPATDNNTVTNPADETAVTTPVPGGTIARPAGSTAANEFVITGVRAQMLAQSLGVQSLDQQATNEEMRVLLAVKRSTSGSNAGKKQAVATFVWGNQTEAIVPINKDTTSVQLDIYPQAQPQFFQRSTSSLNLKAEYPDFQDKTTKSGQYLTDTGAMCAKLTFNFRTDAATPLVFNNADAPLEVCEGETERNAEQAALTKASTGLMFTNGSVGAAPLTYVKFDGVAKLPTAEEFNALAGTTGTVTTQTMDEFFAPLVVMPPEADKDNWTAEQKAQATLARKYTSLKKQFGYYYREFRVYTVTNGARAEVYILGLNGWGVGGLKTYRFL